MNGIKVPMRVVLMAGDVVVAERDDPELWAHVLGLIQHRDAKDAGPAEPPTGERP